MVLVWLENVWLENVWLARRLESGGSAGSNAAGTRIRDVTTDGLMSAGARLTGLILSLLGVALAVMAAVVLLPVGCNVSNGCPMDVVSWWETYWPNFVTVGGSDSA